ncbi:hypothetical protein H1R20_g3203, partial [Candolleomyces eurysporus]
MTVTNDENTPSGGSSPKFSMNFLKSLAEWRIYLGGFMLFHGRYKGRAFFRSELELTYSVATISTAGVAIFFAALTLICGIVCLSFLKPKKEPLMFGLVIVSILLSLAAFAALCFFVQRAKDQKYGDQPFDPNCVDVGCALGIAALFGLQALAEIKELPKRCFSGPNTDFKNLGRDVCNVITTMGVFSCLGILFMLIICILVIKAVRDAVEAAKQPPPVFPSGAEPAVMRWLDRSDPFASIPRGTSSGFGRRLVTSALSRGDRVIATARSLEKLNQELSACGLSESEMQNLRTLQVDITAGEAVLKEKANQAAAFWGRIDVLVNNAGFGQPALVEEGGSKICRRQYEVNVFGLLDMTTATLPHIRASQGYLVNIGSRSAWHTELPGLAFYASSKAAVQALTETMFAELTPLGVKVLLVAPGAFRTEGIYGGQFPKDNIIPAYDTLREASIKRFLSIAGTEKGDPDKAMDFLVDVVRGEGKAAGRPWPLYLTLGEDAAANARSRGDKVVADIENWKDLTGKAVQFD